MFTVHCHCDFIEEHIHSGNSRRYPPIAKSHVHNHTEPHLSVIIAERCQFKCAFNVFAHRSSHAIKRHEGPAVADAALRVFGMATSDPMSCITKLFTGTSHLFTLHHPRGFTHTAALTIFGYYSLAHLKANMEIMNELNSL